MTSNSTIIEDIRAAYDCDHRLPHPAAIAVAEHGGTVTLRGTVGSPHQLRAAAEIANSVTGVRRLDNELTLDPRDRWPDGEIRGAALQALMSSEDIPADHIEIHVTNGWLTLKGEVKHQEDSDAAFAAVSGIKGIGGITNEIKVVTAGIR
jgi:osmotically-inducible protein OsmY